MCSVLNRLSSRARRVARPGVWLALACLGTGCEQMVNRSYSHDASNLSGADRIEVTFELRRNAQSGTLEAPAAVQITDSQRIAAVAAVVGRHRQGWTLLLSGSPARRQLAFYAGDRRLATIGVFGQGITDGELVRQLPSAEVSELVAHLGIPWPPLDNPQSPAPTKAP